MTGAQRRIARALASERTWTNWPQMNRLADVVCAELEVREPDRLKFLKLARARLKNGEINSGL